MANAVFCCGRMNPPTLGHLKVVEMMEEFATEQDAETRVFSTFSHDGKKNPLGDEKQGFLVRALNHPVEMTKGPITAIEHLAQEGFTKATVFTGEDRVARYESMVAHAASLGVELLVRPIPRAIDDVSATAARNAAASGDYRGFCTLVPASDPSFQPELFRAVRRGMGVDDAVRESFG